MIPRTDAFVRAAVSTVPRVQSNTPTPFSRLIPFVSAFCEIPHALAYFLVPEIARLYKTKPEEYEKTAKEWTEKYAMDEE